MNNAAMTYKEECEALRAEVERLNAVIESNIDEGINKIMHMSDEQISALAGFEGRSTEDQETIARQCFEIAEQRADHMKLVEENHELRQQLAIAEAQNARLMSALIATRDDLEIRMQLAEDDSLNISNSVLDQMLDAIDLPASREALDAYVAEQTEQLAIDYNTLVEKTGTGILKLIKQRDLAVSTATKARNAAQQCASVCSKHLDVYPALMNMIDVVDCALSAIKESEV